MALTSFGGLLRWPEVGSDIITTIGFTTTTYLIDAADEKAAAILQAPKTGTISAITFRTGVVTTGATVDVRVETVDPATGDPTGTLFGTNTNGSQVIGNGDDQVLFTTTLTAGASVTQGDLLAVVIVNPAGSPGNMQILTLSTNTISFGYFPYGSLYTGSWAKIAAPPPISGLQYNDGSYGYIPSVVIAATTTTTSFNSGTNPNHRALRFQVTAPCRVRGCWVAVDLDGDADVLLVADNWDGTNGAALARVSLDKDVRRAATPGAFFEMFPTSVTLAANTTYRLVLKPTSVTNIVAQAYTVASTAQFDQNGGNQQCYLSTANNPTGSGDWSPTTTTRPFMGLLIDQFDDGASVGSTVYNLSMQ